MIVRDDLYTAAAREIQGSATFYGSPTRPLTGLEEPGEATKGAAARATPARAPKRSPACSLRT